MVNFLKKKKKTGKKLALLAVGTIGNGTDCLSWRFVYSCRVVCLFFGVVLIFLGLLCNLLPADVYVFVCVSVRSYLCMRGLSQESCTWPNMYVCMCVYIKIYVPHCLSVYMAHVLALCNCCKAGCHLQTSAEPTAFPPPPISPFPHRSHNHPPTLPSEIVFVVAIMGRCFFFDG